MLSQSTSHPTVITGVLTPTEATGVSYYGRAVAVLAEQTVNAYLRLISLLR